MTEWDGKTERREGWSEVVVHIAEIKRDVSYIKENLTKYNASFDNHVEEDNEVHQKVERQGVTLTLIMWLFGILTVSLLWIVVRNHK